MKRSVLRALATAFLSTVLAAEATAQANTNQSEAASSRPNDVIVAVDVSGSMKDFNVFQDVKNYVERDVVRSILKTGDRFTLILFGEGVHAMPTIDISSPADIDSAIQEIRDLRATDDFTDLGSALEALDKAMQARNDGEYRPVAVFITDGKNAPPPQSPYSGANLSVDERFKGTGQRIARKGWFLYVVGLGSGTDAATVGSAVEGSTVVEGSVPGKADAGSGSSGTGSSPTGGSESTAAVSDALSAAPLTAYLEETAKVTEKRAADSSTAKNEPASPARSSSISPVILIVAGGITLLAIIVVIVVATRRKKDENQEQ